MNINENILHITGGACISESLENDVEYILIAPLAVYSKENRSNQDGTENQLFKAKICGEIKMTKGDKVIFGSKKGSQSQVFRYAVRQRADEKGEDKEMFYSYVMSKLLNAIKTDPDKLEDFLLNL